MERWRGSKNIPFCHRRRSGLVNCGEGMKGEGAQRIDES